MERQRANAYRHLLYMAMVDIRNSASDHRIQPSLNPLRWWRTYKAARGASAIADWLHNMAAFAAQDFEGFDEEQFWNEYEYFRLQWKGRHLERFRSAFEMALEGKPGGASYWPDAK